MLQMERPDQPRSPTGPVNADGSSRARNPLKETNSPLASRQSISRKPLPTSAVPPPYSETEGTSAPAPPPHLVQTANGFPDDAQLKSKIQLGSMAHDGEDSEQFYPALSQDQPVPPTHTIPLRQAKVSEPSAPHHQSHIAEIRYPENEENFRPVAANASPDQTEPVTPTYEEAEQYPRLQYHHQPYEPEINVTRKRGPGHGKSLSNSSGSARSVSDPDAASTNSSRYMQVPRTGSARPASAYTLGSELNVPGRTNSPRLSMGGSSPSGGSPRNHARSGARPLSEARPTSYIDLLNLPYAQQNALSAGLIDTSLRQNVGTNASLLDSKKTLEMYRANVKKTTDSAVQYEFAVFMINSAKEAMVGQNPDITDYNELLKEARQILQRLSDRAYPFAQYYLGDGYASGLLNKQKEDWDRAFALFVAASKHGHAEAGYRAALCYEFGWGCRKDYAKAVQFYRASASKYHPGAATRLGKACIHGDMGLAGKYREGLTWLKRAAESADATYNSGSYELGCLHEVGFGPDCFKDEAYAAQLFTKAADLNHPEAALKLGKAYEHGTMSCPRDPALSLHFYHTAAQGGLPEGMMCLCAWYMVGAEPILEKDENEAYEWAKRAAESGLPKAEYAVGYFTEMGIGCRRDPLESNVWYVRAADQGHELAKQRLAIIRSAASGGSADPNLSFLPDNSNGSTLKKANGKDKECIVM